MKYSLSPRLFVPEICLSRGLASDEEPRVKLDPERWEDADPLKGIGLEMRRIPAKQLFKYYKA